MTAQPVEEHLLAKIREALNVNTRRRASANLNPDDGDPCSTCGHPRSLHVPKCEARLCPCRAFSERVDPSPPDDLDWDDPDDQGMP